MATLTKENFNVYVDNKLDNSISVYKLNADEYIILLSDYVVTKNDSRGVYYLNLTKKRVYLLTVRKLEIKDNGKTMKINKSSMKDLWILQTVDHSKKTLTITNDEIRFTPNPDLFTGGENPDRIDKKEVILKRR